MATDRLTKLSCLIMDRTYGQPSVVVQGQTTFRPENCCPVIGIVKLNRNGSCFKRQFALRHAPEPLFQPCPKAGRWAARQIAKLKPPRSPRTARRAQFPECSCFFLLTAPAANKSIFSSLLFPFSSEDAAERCFCLKSLGIIISLRTLDARSR